MLRIHIKLSVNDMQFLSAILERISQLSPASPSFVQGMQLEWAVLTSLYHRQIRNWIFISERSLALEIAEAIALVRVLYVMELPEGDQADIFRNSLITRIETRIPWKI